MAKLLSKEEELILVSAIADAEKQTSGEIRVHIENNCNGDAIQRSVQLFEQLGMTKTEKKKRLLIWMFGVTAGNHENTIPFKSTIKT